MPSVHHAADRSAFAQRALPTALIDLLETDPASVDPAQVGPQLVAAVRAGGVTSSFRSQDSPPSSIHDIVSAAELVARLVADSADAVRRASQLPELQRQRLTPTSTSMTTAASGAARNLANQEGLLHAEQTVGALVLRSKAWCGHGHRKDLRLVDLVRVSFVHDGRRAIREERS